MIFIQGADIEFGRTAPRAMMHKIVLVMNQVLSFEIARRIATAVGFPVDPVDLPAICPSALRDALAAADVAP